MAFKRTFKRRRPVRRFRRTFRRRFRGRRTNGMGAYAKRFFKLRRVIPVVSPGNINKFDSFNDNPSLYQDWVPVSDLFQMYRVNGIKLTWIPTFNTNALATTVGQFTPMYMFHDTTNQISSPPSEDTVLQFENLRIRSISRMHSTYFKFSRRLNAAAPGTISPDGYNTVSAPQATQQICTLIPATTGSSTSVPLGRFVCTMYLSAKVRR